MLYCTGVQAEIAEDNPCFYNPALCVYLKLSRPVCLVYVRLSETSPKINGEMRRCHSDIITFSDKRPCGYHLYQAWTRHGFLSHSRFAAVRWLWFY